MTALLQDTTHTEPEVDCVSLLTTLVLSSLSGLQAIETEWKELHQRIDCRNPFISFDWLFSWWQHFGLDRKLFIIIARDTKGRLVAIAPLCLDERKWGGGCRARRLGFMGSGPSDRLDLLTDPAYLKPAVQALAAMLMQKQSMWDCIEISDGDAASPALAELRESLRRAGLVESVRTGSVCPYVPLPSSFDEFMKGLGKNLRRNFARRQRSMEEAGRLEFIAVSEPSEMLHGFEELVALHRLRFTQRGDESPFLQRELPFHRDFLKSSLGRECARLFFVRIDGKPIGAWFGFSLGGVFFSYQSGMDPAWAKLSVGLVTLGSTIQHCLEMGHHEVDFLRGAEDYKYQWTSHDRQNVAVHYFARHWRGRLCRSQTALHEAAIRPYRASRRWLKKTLRRASSQTSTPSGAVPGAAVKKEAE